MENNSLKIRLRMNNHWTKIAGTNGYNFSFMTDYLKDSIVGGEKDRYTATSWYVFMPENMPSTRPQPLWRKESKNWEDWSKNK